MSACGKPRRMTRPPRSMGGAGSGSGGGSGGGLSGGGLSGGGRSGGGLAGGGLSGMPSGYAGAVRLATGRRPQPRREGDEVEPGWVPPGIDTGKANTARVYDYWLGGSNNFLADQDAARAMLAVDPTLRAPPRENRAFPAPAVRYPAGASGAAARPQTPAAAPSR